MVTTKRRVRHSYVTENDDDYECYKRKRRKPTERTRTPPFPLTRLCLLLLLLPLLLDTSVVAEMSVIRVGGESALERCVCVEGRKEGRKEGRRKRTLINLSLNPLDLLLYARPTLPLPPLLLQHIKLLQLAFKPLPRRLDGPVSSRLNPVDLAQMLNEEVFLYKEGGVDVAQRGGGAGGREGSVGGGEGRKMREGRQKGRKDWNCAVGRPEA